MTEKKKKQISKEKVVQRQNGGRARVTIDWKVVENALQSHCTGPEIAAYLGIHPETLYDNVKREFGLTFTDYSAQFKAKGKSLLRMSQFDEAIRQRDRGMMIWLGKQLLGQRENHNVEVSGQGIVVKMVSYKDLEG